MQLATTDKHSRVKWAALNCLAQLATDFGTGFCRSYHAKVMPLFISLLNQNNPPRYTARFCLPLHLQPLATSRFAAPLSHTLTHVNPQIGEARADGSDRFRRVG